MSKTDFQNGFALGLASGGVVEVEDTTEIDNLENLIDESGVLDSTEGSVTDKVEQLIDKADFIGVKYFNYALTHHGYNLPQTADARSLDKILKDPNEITPSIRQAENNQCLAYKFANITKNPNGAYFYLLKDVYLPSKATGLVYTFQNCVSLKNVYGDLSNITTIGASAFDGCTALSSVPNIPNVNTIGNFAFRGCTSLTEVKLPSTITSINGGAFTGCTNIQHIYCPWAEGTVANAPWGATKATIHYNYVEGEETNAES